MELYHILSLRLTALLFTLVVALTAFSAEPVDSISDEDPYIILMGEADKAIERGEWNEAAARLNDAISIRPTHPSNVILRSNLAVVYTCMGMDSLALVTYDDVLAETPELKTAVMGRAKLLLKMGRDSEAYDDLSQMIELDSLATEPRFYRGMMYLYGGKATEAEADFSILKKIIPESTDTAIALGTFYALTGRDAEALPYLERLIESNPEPEFYSQLAGCYLALGRLTEASETISEGLKRFPSDPELFYYRAWLNRDLFLLDQAKNDAEKALRLGASPAKVADLFK